MIHIVANSKAGSGRGAQVWQQVEKYLQQAHIAYTPVGETLPPSGSTVMLIGGDGTYCQFVNRLQRPEDYRYILVRAGSSNSLWSTFGNTHATTDLMDSDFIHMDLGEVHTDQEHFFFWNEASLGFAAAIGTRTIDSPLKRLMNRWHMSEWSYILTAFSVWMSEEPVMINLMNNNRISGDLRPCPNATPDDGKVDVSVLECPRWRLPLELARMIGLAQTNRSRYATTYHDTTWTTQRSTPLPVEADGEPMQDASEVRFGCYREQVEVKFWEAPFPPNNR